MSLTKTPCGCSEWMSPLGKEIQNDDPSTKVIAPAPKGPAGVSGQGVPVSALEEPGDGWLECPGSSGQTLVFNRSWLARMLDKLDRWLILEVEIQRRSNDTSSRRSKLADYDERLGFSSPYTKYFLIDATGEAHEF